MMDDADWSTERIVKIDMSALDPTCAMYGSEGKSLFMFDAGTWVWRSREHRDRLGAMLKAEAHKIALNCAVNESGSTQ